MSESSSTDRLSFDFHSVQWLTRSFGLHWFLCYSSSKQNCPCPPNSKSKTRGGQRHSWSVALRPHEQPMSLAFIPPPLFFLPALDGREMTLKRVPYVPDKMGLYGAHLRFNEHVFLIKHSFIHHVSVKETCTWFMRPSLGLLEMEKYEVR